MPPSLTRFLARFALPALAVSIGACPRPAVAPAPAHDDSGIPATSPSASTVGHRPLSASASSTAPERFDFPRVAVRAPVYSDDACTRDSDCVPLRTCHPDRCVSPSHAGGMAPGTMCTMDCRGGTLDCGFNRCGCAAGPGGKKLCAVLPVAE